MERFIRRGIAATLFFVIPTLFAGGGFAGDDDFHHNRLNRLLRGDYAFTSFRSCIQALQPAFDENLVLLNPATSRTTAIQGTLRYNGNGTGSVALRFLNIFPERTMPAVSPPPPPPPEPPPPPLPLLPPTRPVNGGETACELEYAVNADGSFVQRFSNCRGGVEFGAGVGQTFEIIEREEMGQVSQDRKMLILHDTNPNVETLDVTLPNGFIVVVDRICNRSGVAVKVHRHAHHDHVFGNSPRRGKGQGADQ